MYYVSWHYNIPLHCIFGNYSILLYYVSWNYNIPMYCIFGYYSILLYYVLEATISHYIISFETIISYCIISLETTISYCIISFENTLSYCIMSCENTVPHRIIFSEKKWKLKLTSLKLRKLLVKLIFKISDQKKNLQNIATHYISFLNHKK